MEKKVIFSKEDTGKVKGAAILIMLLYHLFGLKYNYINYDVEFLFLSTNQVVDIAKVGNVCVSIFAFLSAFGISRKLEELNTKNKIAINAFRQYKNLLITFIPIYITSLVIFSYWLPISEVYGNGFGKYIYMFLDMFGLSNLFGGVMFNPTWWYMTLAILIIFLTPFLNVIYDKVGVIIIPLIALLPLFIETNFMIAQYTFVITCGVCFSREKTLEKVKTLQIGKNMRISNLLKLIALIVGICVFSYLKQSNTIPIKVTYYAEQILAIQIILFVYIFITKFKIISYILSFLGKHSANIYFTHTFFIIWATDIKDWIFGLKYAWLITIVVLIMCIVYSYLLEGIKKGFFLLIKSKR